MSVYCVVVVIVRHARTDSLLTSEKLVQDAQILCIYIKAHKTVVVRFRAIQPNRYYFVCFPFVRVTPSYSFVCSFARVVFFFSPFRFVYFPPRRRMTFRDQWFTAPALCVPSESHCVSNKMCMHTYILRYDETRVFDG